MTYTLRQLEHMLATHSLPKSMARDLAQIPGFEDRHLALRDLAAYVRERRAWAERKADERRGRHGRARAALVKKRDREVVEVMEGFSEFGADPKGSSYGDFIKAWERVADWLDKREISSRRGNE